MLQHQRAEAVTVVGYDSAAQQRQTL